MVDCLDCFDPPRWSSGYDTGDRVQARVREIYGDSDDHFNDGPMSLSPVACKRTIETLISSPLQASVFFSCKYETPGLTLAGDVDFKQLN